MDITKEQLDAPAFGTEAPVEPTVVEPTKEEVPVTSEEETKVPYSRFKKIHERAKEAEEEAARWREKAEAYDRQPKLEREPSGLPDFWVKLYGDSEASKEAWKIQSEQNETIKAEARREALEAVRNERLEEAQRTEENVGILDENFEDLSAIVGRDLTDKEQSAILDIVDDYTPKDRDGNYAGQILSFDKAWEIYELRNQSAKAPKRESRDNAASLSGSQSQGDTSITEKDKNFNPSWGAVGEAMRRRL
jgi:hypothetical protein